MRVCVYVNVQQSRIRTTHVWVEKYIFPLQIKPQQRKQQLAALKNSLSINKAKIRHRHPSATNATLRLCTIATLIKRSTTNSLSRGAFVRQSLSMAARWQKLAHQYSQPRGSGRMLRKDGTSSPINYNSPHLLLLFSCHFLATDFDSPRLPRDIGKVSGAPVRRCG